MTSFDEYNKAIKAVLAAQEEASRVAKDAFHEGAKDVFEKYGDIVGGFGWSQYTPYFNDGDPCEFDVNEVVLWAPSTDPYEVDMWVGDEAFSNYGSDSKAVETIWSGRGSSCVPNPNYDPYYAEAKNYVQGFMAGWSQDTLKQLFGDHVQVRVTPSGVDVDKYEHE